MILDLKSLKSVEFDTLESDVNKWNKLMVSSKKADVTDQS